MNYGKQFTIRPMKAEDRQQWAKMRQGLWPKTSIDEHRKEMEEFFGQPSFQAWVVATENELVGFAEVYLRPYANGCKSRPIPFLEGIWIRPEWRKKGLGRALIETIQEWAKGKGFSELGSDTNMQNMGSIAAHQRWGFQETERVVYFRKII